MELNNVPLIRPKACTEQLLNIHIDMIVVELQNRCSQYFSCSLELLLFPRIAVFRLNRWVFTRIIVEFC